MFYIKKCLYLALLFSQFSYANFIIRYQDGTTEISKYDPRLLSGQALVSKSVDYIEEDRVLHAHQVSLSDPYVRDQWIFMDYLEDSFNKAKILERDMQRVNVAVVDTGILVHEDLENIFQGADFISDTTNSRDGDARDLDPRDEGDYGPSSCTQYNRDSSWHGTHIAGIIGASSYNDKGIKGINDKVNIVPARVLGACGGRTSDIADAIKWSVGEPIDGLSINTNPVKVVNLSLGGKGPCSQYLQEAIDIANQKGALVVVSAGNDGANIDNGEYTPVNCKGVFKVGSVHSSLTQSSFSNYGNAIDVYAPGDSIYSTFNNGSSTPSYDDYYYLSGTSMSAGVVSSIAAGIMGLNPSLTLEQVKNILATSGEEISCYFGDCTSKLSLNPLIAYQKAVTTLRDSNFKYDDNDVEGGVEQINSNDTNFTTNNDGGKCGTILRGSSKLENEKLKNTFFFMVLMFIAMNLLFGIRQHDR